MSFSLTKNNNNNQTVINHHITMSNKRGYEDEYGQIASYAISHAESESPWDTYPPDPTNTPPSIVASIKVFNLNLVTHQMVHT